MDGTITRLIAARGFGFIESGGKEFFFHMSALKGVPFEELAAGQPVVFEVSEETGDRPGEHPRAVNIELADNAVPAADNTPLPREKVHPQGSE